MSDGYWWDGISVPEGGTEEDRWRYWMSRCEVAENERDRWKQKAETAEERLAAANEMLHLRMRTDVTRVVEVRHDGEVAATFGGDHASVEAILWMVDRFGDGPHHDALAHDGWAIVSVKSDGTETHLAP